MREGAKVAIFGRNPATVSDVAAELGPSGIGLAGDVAKRGDLEALFESTEREFGKVDIVFANAGIAPLVRLDEGTDEDFDRVFDVNVKGVFFTVQAALPHLRDGASIIFTGSVASVVGVKGYSAYAASKAAVRSLGRTLAAELAPRSIRVNVLSPGPIETPIFDRMDLPSDTQQKMIDNITAHVPMRRFGKVSEIAEPVVFLASDESSYMTGSEITVDGGMVQL